MLTTLLKALWIVFLGVLLFGVWIAIGFIFLETNTNSFATLTSGIALLVIWIALVIREFKK
jgi:hypothetical protein